MKYIALDTTFDWKNKRMDIVHKLLFHGHAMREDSPSDPSARDRSSSSHTIGDDLSHPLLLMRSGVFVPAIFKTHNALVIRDELYRTACAYPKLAFAKCRPVKLINYWKEAGDFSFYESKDPAIRKNIRRPDMLLDWMKLYSHHFQYAMNLLLTMQAIIVRWSLVISTCTLP